jgi:signal peptidase I
VPAGNYLLLGDNAADSNDSRSFGYVPAADILGVAAGHAFTSMRPSPHIDHGG